MDKKTIIAVVLAVVVIIASMLLQNVFFPTREEPLPVSETPVETVVQADATEETAQQEPLEPQADQQTLLQVEGEELYEQTYRIETNVFTIIFSNRGGTIQSIKLKDFRNSDGSEVEMILPRESGRYPFTVHFGDFNAPPVDALFNYEEALLGNRATFYQVFNSPSGVPFKLIKTYIVHPDDYMIELQIAIENSINEYPDLNFNGISYTLGFGPQIGPDFKKLDRRNEYRNYLYQLNGKKKTLRPAKSGVTPLEERVPWTTISGKYFQVIAVPDATDYKITYDSRPIEGLKDQSSFYFGRPEIKSSKSIDVFRFYIGPKKRDMLLRYNETGKNAYGLRDMHFEQTVSASVIIGWLAAILKFFLELFHKVIPNYGVAILLLTVLIKIVLYPLTHKSFESTARMQALQPKIAEIKEKYKGNPQKLQQETAALYKREKVNPLGGCLPMLLQMPIFFAFYNLLSTHFELRGAMFIPGWIMDLSAPESIWDFSPFALPIVGWQNLRLLPLIMVATTFLQSKLTPTGDTSNKQMKMMTYMMPLMFFFILYEMPSGLVLYWTMQNVLTVFQQMIISKLRQKKADEGEPDQKPGGGRKRKK